MYLKKLILQTENFIKRLRWKAFWFESSGKEPPNLDANNQNENYGFKSSNTPPQHPDLLKFEADMYEMISNVKFQNANSKFQSEMQNDLKKLKSGGKVVVEADKTSNLYQLDPEKYNRLLNDNITKDYKVAPNGTKEDINRRTNILARKLKIDDKMECYTEIPCFITLKDHKDNFTSNTKCRLINPAKSNLGSVSKKILEKLISAIKLETGDNLWKSTTEVLTWFKDLKDLKMARFLKFDIQEFYPSITADLLDSALKYASTIVHIPEDEKEIIKLSKESLLMNSNKCWVKKSDTNFDVTMGSLDGAETSELIGLYLLSKIKKIIPQQYLGLYRDDGLAVINKTNGQRLDKIRKQLHSLFQKEGLKITVDLCQHSVDFLDVVLDLTDKSYRPYRKPNDTPLYINAESNHPPIILKNLPSMIESRLISISSNKTCLNEAKSDYEKALRDSGYNHTIDYKTPQPKKRKRSRKRNILWYNPPFSANVSTNIGRKFFALIDKHFPKNLPLHKIINRNTVKISYCCMPSLGRILKGHNKSVLEKQSEKNKAPEKECNCRDASKCPLKGQCLAKCIVYQATVKTASDKESTYIGLTENSFKTRWYNHRQSFKNPKHRLSTELSKLVWGLKEKSIEYSIDWKIITKSKKYKAGAGHCSLCLDEKLYILKNSGTINKRSEIISKCRHSRKFLVRHI